MNDQQKRRRKILEKLEDLGYSKRDAIMFLAGATLLGYMADNRASWARDHLIRKYLDGCHEGDQLLERAGREDYNLEEWEQRTQEQQKEMRKNCGRCNGAGIIILESDQEIKVPCPVCNRQALR